MKITKRISLIILCLNIFAIVFADGSKKIIINEFLASNSTGLVDVDGEHSDWIEIYNPGNTTIDLSGWRLTDSKEYPLKWAFPNISIQGGQFIVIFASGKDKIAENNELHTNFSLSKDGEYLAIIEPNGTISDEYTPTFPVQQSDVSYGYFQGQQVFFEIPTPGEANTLETKAQTPVFSIERGYFDNPFNVSLTVPDSETTVYYTLNGTRPTEKSTPYSNPISITKTTPLSAVGIKNGIQSPIVTNTYYFINDIVKQPNNPSGYPDRWGYLGNDIKYNNYAVGERAPADYAMDPNICEDSKYKDYIRKAFLDIPSVSIVTNPGYLFSDSIDDNEGGIYIYTGVDVGAEWERPASIEYFDPSTEKQFQINCGLKLHGAASRQPEKTGKHSFKVAFKTLYGKGKLEFDLFDNETAVKKFDNLVFRAGYNQSWLHPDSWQRTNSQYANDSFAKRIQRDMGHLSSHDRFAHLFINGLYWGLYDISERVNDNFMKAYFEGSEEDFDVINHDGLSDGDITAYNRLLELAKVGNYDQLNSEQLLDMENYIDYMLLNFYIGNVDWGTNNWYIARNRIYPESGFLFFSWDAESSLTDVNINRINGSNGFQGKFRSMFFGSSSGTATTGGLYNNEEFRLLFTDRVNKHFFNGGSLTPEKTEECYRQLADQIDLPIILESARWGDYRKNTLTPGNSRPPVYTRNDHWLPRKEQLLTDYFPKRANIVYNQLKELGLVSEIEPPQFNNYGEIIDNTPIQLTMTASQGTIYYTTNGIDPRDHENGNVSVYASEFKLPIQVSEACVVKARAKNGLIWSALTEATFAKDNISNIVKYPNDIQKVYYKNNMLNLALSKEGNILLEIYSVDGKCIQNTRVVCQAGNNEIELCKLYNGVYVYKIIFDEKTYIGKFIK